MKPYVHEGGCRRLFERKLGISPVCQVYRYLVSGLLVVRDTLWFISESCRIHHPCSGLIPSTALAILKRDNDQWRMRGKPPIKSPGIITNV
jgi:hypothetical protein